MDHDSYYYISSYQDDSDDCDQFDNTSDNTNEMHHEMSGDALLISLVRDYPYLYNKELTDFKDNVKRQNAWVEIGNIMDMTVEECQTRWMRLRERYSREKKQRQEETTTGSGASKRKTFEFFDNMQFLDRFVKRRKTMTNIHNIQKKSISPATGSFNLQKNFDSPDEKENNTSSVNVATSSKQPSIESTVDITKTTVQHVNKKSLTPDLHSNVSDSSSTSAISVSNSTRDKSLIGQRIKLKGKSQPDVLENAIGKVTSLLENRCGPPASSSSSLKPEIDEDIAFCQLILSLLGNMSHSTKADKKKEMLRILYDM